MPAGIQRAISKRSAINAASGSPTKNGPPPVRYMPAPPDWQHCRSVAITLTNLPEETTTWNLWEALAPCGNIVYIEIMADRQGNSRGRANVRFQPPPKITCWAGGRCGIMIGQSCFNVTVESQPSKGEEWVDTPLKNRIPVRISMLPTELSFGCLIQPEEMMEMTTIGQPPTTDPDDTDDPLELAVDFRTRRLTLSFPVTLSHAQQVTRQDYRCSIKFDQITRLYQVGFGADGGEVIIGLEHPPAFSRKRTRARQTHADDNLKWTERELWARAVDICTDPMAKRDHPEKLRRDTDLIHIGRWTTYRIVMTGSGLEAWSMICKALGDFNIHPKNVTTFGLTPVRECDLWDLLEPAHATSDDQSALAMLEDKSKVHLPFDVIYQLQVCVSHGYLNEYNVSRDFLLKLAELADPKSFDCERAKLVLEYVADQKKRVFDPMTIFEDRGAKTYFPPTFSMPNHCVMMRKATITPTTIYFSSPTVEPTNRVVRHYSNVRDHFLRVQFTDEIPLGRIFAGPDTTRDNDVFTRVHRVLFKGIQIGDRHYQFLAFGNSQIRENGAYFFAPVNGITCDHIRSWMGMGSLGHIKTVAKVAARLGQCFSTTRVVYGVSAPRVTIIPDIEIVDIEKNVRRFTDGVGKISSFLAGTIAQDWKLSSVPSVFQFRMGGCKGILAVSPELKGPDVHIRLSQKKFDSNQKFLEIIKCSQFSVATLNRQSITLLSNLGIPNEVFEDMLQKQLDDYDTALRDPQVALRLLNQFVDENQMTVNIARMLADGFMTVKEPFLMTLLFLWRSWSIKQLKEKARLIVTEGAFVFGCVDETGELRGHVNPPPHLPKGSKYRGPLPQIFIQVADPEKGHEYKAITGLCLVGRNPSLHPGDLRVVEAVDIEALHHLKDVVVFPQHGDRDIPSMCSGGDLDGDDYFVIWDQRLIPNESERNQTPMDYKSPTLADHGRPITVDDLRTFFVLYMKNNSLPVIAHAHLAWADWLTPEHSKHEKCKSLAELHSKAVDYVKTGEPALMDKAVNPRSWPHWMEKPGRSYKSYEVLGRLYDRIQRIDFRPGYDMPFDGRILARRFPDRLDAELLLKRARQIKSQYDVHLRRVMGQLEIRTEFEVWSAFVLSKPRVGSGYKLQEVVGRQSLLLKQQYRAICEDAAMEAATAAATMGSGGVVPGSEPGPEADAGTSGATTATATGGAARDFETLGPFVAAMYRVTWEEVQIALHEARHPHVRANGRIGRRAIKPESMPLISFPWLFETVLGRLATGRGSAGQEADLAKMGFDANRAAKAAPPRATSNAKMVVEGEEEAGDEDIDEGLFDAAAMEYVRTTDGKVMHRGQVLRLFWDESDDELDGYGRGGDGTGFSGSPENEAEAEAQAGEVEVAKSHDAVSDQTAPAAGPDTPQQGAVSSTSKMPENGLLEFAGKGHGEDTARTEEDLLVFTKPNAVIGGGAEKVETENDDSEEEIEYEDVVLDEAETALERVNKLGL